MPLLAGVEGEDLALLPVLPRHVREHAGQPPPGGLGDKRRMIQRAGQLSQAGHPETVVRGKELLGWAWSAASRGRLCLASYASSRKAMRLMMRSPAGCSEGSTSSPGSRRSWSARAADPLAPRQADMTTWGREPRAARTARSVIALERHVRAVADLSWPSEQAWQRTIGHGIRMTGPEDHWLLLHGTPLDSGGLGRRGGVPGTIRDSAMSGNHPAAGARHAQGALAAWLAAEVARPGPAACTSSATPSAGRSRSTSRCSSLGE